MIQPDEILIIDRDTVVQSLNELDPVSIVESSILQHARGESNLPTEAYMAWENSSGAYTRSVGMLGAVKSGEEWAYGMKLINSSVTNPQLGMERAGGFTVLFDSETARPSTLLEAGYISALRTAAYTVSTLRALGPVGFTKVSILGCGTLARMHVRLLRRYFPKISEIHVYDIQRNRTLAFAQEMAVQEPSLSVVAHDDVRLCVAQAQVLVTVTVSSNPYISPDWFNPGSFVAHVSLDDLTAEAFLDAEAVYVDDLDLVRDNPRRILGRAMHAGKVVSPEEASAPERGLGRKLSGTYGNVLAGLCTAHRPTDGLVISNPFGMAIMDVAMCHAVAKLVKANGLGTQIDLLGRHARSALPPLAIKR